IPIIDKTRNLDVKKVEDINISMVDPFITTGYTLRPFIYSMEWIEGGEEHVYGASYVVPIQRGLSNFIPFMEPISYDGKSYSFRDRLPTMGYSVISEAYYNLNLLGVLLIMTIIPFLLGYIGDRAKSFITLSIITGMNAILINNIRNAFSFVPGQIVMLLFIFLIASIINKLLKRNNLSKVDNLMLSNK